MKISFEESWEAKQKRLEQWHVFYPWFPRKVAENDWRCFESVMRIGIYHIGWVGDDHWSWKYKVIERSENEN